MRAPAAGKHVYGEKPLALNPGQAAPVLTLADECGLRVGSAPDTVLGTGVQIARALLDGGRIGMPVAASAFWTTPGMSSGTRGVFHVVEIMSAVVRAGHDHTVIELASTVERPDLVPEGAVPSNW
nr:MULTISPECIES: hypothetical protein [Cryobacterium]